MDSLLRKKKRTRRSARAACRTPTLNRRPHSTCGRALTCSFTSSSRVTGPVGPATTAATLARAGAAAAAGAGAGAGAGAEAAEAAPAPAPGSATQTEPQAEAAYMRAQLTQAYRGSRADTSCIYHTGWHTHTQAGPHLGHPGPPPAAAPRPPACSCPAEAAGAGLPWPAAPTAWLRSQGPPCGVHKAFHAEQCGHTGVVPQPSKTGPHVLQRQGGRRWGGQACTPRRCH